MNRYTKVLSLVLLMISMFGVSRNAVACSSTGRSWSSDETKTLETRIFTVKNVQSEDVCQALLLFHTEMVSNERLRTISVTAPKETLNVIDDVIKRLDVAPPTPQPFLPNPWISRDMQLTVYVLGADNTQTARPPVPAALQSVVDGLKSILTYKSFYVVDTLYQAGKTDNQIMLSGKMPDLGYLYDFTVRATVDSADSTHSTIKLPILSFKVYGGFGPDGKVPTLASISSPIDVQQGKQTVIGKATVGDSAYILVISVNIH